MGLLILVIVFVGLFVFLFVAAFKQAKKEEQEWEEKKGEREIHREDNVQNGNKTKAERTELPINIEGEARSVEPARNFRERRR